MSAPAAVNGLHHVTALASSASANNAFWTGTLGLRRVKKTVNFDAPDVYHLYYGDRVGTPGTVMTYFPFPNAARGTRGTGEAVETAFAVPAQSLGTWEERLAEYSPRHETRFGQPRLAFSGPDGESLALVEVEDKREPWTGGGIDAETAIRGFHSVTLRLAQGGPTAALLTEMGYGMIARDGDLVRYAIEGGNGADVVDIEVTDTEQPGRQGAGSVHHVAFSVPTRDDQLALRDRLARSGFQPTQQIDRDYFWAIYFRSPGGVLFEVATAEPGFDRDEDVAHLGEALKLPDRHAHLRERLEAALEPIG